MESYKFEDLFQKDFKVTEQIINISAVRIENGFKAKVKKDVLNLILNDNSIQEDFKLNIKRLNRWWYSVYFENKE